MGAGSLSQAGVEKDNNNNYNSREMNDDENRGSRNAGHGCWLHLLLFSFSRENIQLHLDDPKVN